MATKIYGISNCDTIKKARKWMEQRDIIYDFHDYKKAGVDGAMLKDWIAQVGWETLLNKRGTTFKKLPAANRENIDESKAIMLMMEYPSMIKRPVLETEMGLLVGFKSSEYETALIE